MNDLTTPSFHSDTTGDHLPKFSSTQTIQQIYDVMDKVDNAPAYDRPDDDGQSLLAHKTPGSVIAAQKFKKPSRERHSGD